MEFIPPCAYQNVRDAIREKDTLYAEFDNLKERMGKCNKIIEEATPHFLYD